MVGKCLLGVDRADTRNCFLENIEKDLNRIKRSKDRHTVLDRAAADRYTIFVVDTGEDPSRVRRGPQRMSDVRS